VAQYATILFVFCDTILETIFGDVKRREETAMLSPKHDQGESGPTALYEPKDTRKVSRDKAKDEARSYFSENQRVIP
jgi:hypothetical protein